MPAKRNQEDIINDFKKKHGDKYDYSKVIYVNSKTKVIIGCPKHGNFEQTPNRHKQGDGCPKCSGTKKITQGEIIDQFKEKHGENTYDYSKVIYVNSMTKVIISCPKHGDFEQTPSHHKGGQGCKKCGYKKNGDKKRNTTEKFIAESKGIHGDRYDYSKVIYINSNKKVIIVCPEHGDFKQLPASHTQGFGCWRCGCEYRGNQKRKSCEDFIKEAKEKWGDEYDYSKVVYINTHKKVTIVCREHGDFKQTPNSHLQGQRCPQCYGNIKWTTEDFIKKAQEMHGNKYDYSKSICNGVDKHVIIICDKHGEFKQTPWNHAQVGQGCRRCSCADKSSKPAKGWIKYLLVSKPWLHHGGSEEGEYLIPNTRGQRADAYDKETKTIYEFHGDFWHGNPKKYNPEDINPKSKKPFGKLYKNTLHKELLLKKQGYNYVCIWDSEWKKTIQTIITVQKLWRSKCSKV